jgi:hypothetical protein
MEIQMLYFFLPKTDAYNFFFWSNSLAGTSNTKGSGSGQTLGESTIFQN